MTQLCSAYRGSNKGMIIRYVQYMLKSLHASMFESSCRMLVNQNNRGKSQRTQAHPVLLGLDAF